MITLIGSLIGFLGAAFPDMLKLFKDGQDRKHELVILQMQMEPARKRPRTAARRNQCRG